MKRRPKNPFVKKKLNKAETIYSLARVIRSQPCREIHTQLYLDFRIPLEKTDENASLFDYDPSTEDIIDIPDIHKREKQMPLGSRLDVVIQKIDDKNKNTSPVLGINTETFLQWSRDQNNLPQTLALYNGVRQMQFPNSKTRGSLFYDWMNSLLISLSPYDGISFLAGVGKTKMPLINLHPMSVFPNLKSGFSLK